MGTIDQFQFSVKICKRKLFPIPNSAIHVSFTARFTIPSMFQVFCSFSICSQLTSQACRSESLWLNSFFFVCFNSLSRCFRLNYGKRCEKQINVKKPRKTLRLITVMCVCSQLLDYRNYWINEVTGKHQGG